MAALYEVIFRERLYRRASSQHYPGAITVGLLLVLLTSTSLYYGSTTFVAATISLIVTAAFMMLFRPDLLATGLITGLITLVVCLPFYYSIMLVSPHWIDTTYVFAHLSNIRFTGIPVEELIFWFLGGLVFGPFYEYWKNERLRKVSNA